MELTEKYKDFKAFCVWRLSEGFMVLNKACSYKQSYL